MAGRILSLQRQARELGRLRTGYTDTSGRKPRPVKSETWVITSHSEGYVAAAAEAWGGTVERWNPLGGGAPQYRAITEAAALDAILPPGDPLSQAYELWSGGGCARRCDGITETLSDRPCICRAEHGDDFHAQPKGSVCSATTRLNVFLPEMPDVGVWRVETHSFYAAQEMAGAVDLIRSAVGPDAVIPIRLRIENRTRKAQGKTKQYPVIVIELRGITTGQVLGASVMGGQQLAAQAQREALGASGPAAAAIEAAPARAPEEPSGKPAFTAEQEETLLTQIKDTDDIDSVRAMWTDLAARFHMPVASPVAKALQARAAELTPQTEQDAVTEMATSRSEPAPAASDDPDDLWAQILRTVPADWTSEKVEHEFAQFAGTPADVAGAPDMRAYLDKLRGEQ
ncbi:hypothetical protein [Pseudonocardia zijingensis]|uniref:Uncharacterized protein n=1 Tax=Pseudonocardia zijingensis TaxID=153376 RepID=A0ABP3YLE1_9PSEU